MVAKGGTRLINSTAIEDFKKSNLIKKYFFNNT